MVLKGPNMNIIAGTQNTLAQDMIDSMARFRYRVFVEMLGWGSPRFQCNK